MTSTSFDSWENELCHYGVKGMQWRNKKGAQTFYRFPDGRVINLRSGKRSEPDAMKTLFRQSAGMPTQQKSTGFEVAKDIPQRSAQPKVANVEQTTNEKGANKKGAQTFYRFPDGRVINLRSGKRSEPDAMKKLFRQSAGMPTQQQRSAQPKVANVEQTTNKKEAAPFGKRTVITNPIYQNRKKQMRKSR